MTSVAYHGSVEPAPAIARALQQALRSWDHLLEWLPIGIYACDRDGRLVQYNHRAAELWGYAPALGDEQRRFCGAHKAYRPNGEPLPLSETPMAELLGTRRPIRGRELDIERPDGTRLTILGNLDPLFDEDGTLVGGVSCFQDITARKVAEERLQGASNGIAPCSTPFLPPSTPRTPKDASPSSMRPPSSSRDGVQCSAATNGASPRGSIRPGARQSRTKTVPWRWR
jgi:transcriptional regulator with PAS, ATPase and Fis domain